MQELSKRSETLCQVGAITNQLYIENRKCKDRLSISIMASISQP